MKLIALSFFLFSLVSHAALKPGAVVYGVVPCLFGEKCFKSVTEKLPYLKDQGVDVLWISPIYETDDNSLISYATTDYFNIRPDFGSEDDFKRLVTTAHRLGLKVILDFVPNHTSSEHPFFLEAEEDGEDSPYYSFFNRDEEGNYTYYFDWENLPNLNFSNPHVQEHITKAFLHWIEKYDVDGFRVDAAWGIKERNPEFWPTLNRKLKSVKRDIILLAEAGARDNYYFQNGFDFAYDWTKKLGQWSWHNVFQNPEHSPALLHTSILTNSRPEKVARFINNNDTGKRFISTYGLATTKIAAVIQHTVPGLPVVYMGDELGAEFDPYEDPAPLNFQGRFGLKSFYKKLAHLKETLPALHSGNFQKVSVQGSKAVYAFKRSFGQKTVLVVMNFSSRAQKVQLSLSEDLKSTQLTDYLSGTRLKLPDGGISLKAKEVMIIGD